MPVLKLRDHMSILWIGCVNDPIINKIDPIVIIVWKESSGIIVPPIAFDLNCPLELNTIS